MLHNVKALIVSGPFCIVRDKFKSHFSVDGFVAAVFFVCLNVSSFLFYENIGYVGIYIPFNSLILFSVFVFFAVFVFFRRAENFYFPAFFWIILVSLFLYVARFFLEDGGGLLSFNRFWFLLLGVFFFVAVFQLDLSLRGRYFLVFSLVFFIFLHSCVAIVQVIPGQFLYGYVPHLQFRNSPIGMFQQVNVLAVLVACGCALVFYLAVDSIYIKLPFSIRFFLWLCGFVFGFVLLLLGSRIGFLGFALVVFSSSVYAFIFPVSRKIVFFMAVLMSLGGVSSSLTSDGLFRVVSKVENIATGNDVRINLYKTSFDLVGDGVILGHGIGSFQSVFHEKAAYLNKEAEGHFSIGPSTYTHPHNELLYWWIEGGILWGFSFLLLIFFVLLGLFLSDFKSSFFLSVSIVLFLIHLMVELPFYISYYHYFLFLFLVALVFKSGDFFVIDLGDKFRFFNSLYFFKFMFFSLFLMFMFFSLVLFSYSKNLYDSSIGDGEFCDSEYFLYKAFYEYRDVFCMGRRLSISMGSGDVSFVFDYIEWAESYIKEVPSIDVYASLIRANYYVGNLDESGDYLNHLIYLYPDNQYVRAFYKKHYSFYE
ncbi:Lipid A core-O-antigen ligase [Nitrincola lacisaponensis]|uniref:Lipid A core-O-antigen ligase n=1 Tax=Nitrincola lacisaponensis TaxID=267850 RepID=A0A063Y4A0_9GAMM|nr:O-antigen ligase family protein [Nitrincola lacisaponensis]KDE41163.1 Lipid A core-O-antigen ligase [Nitrincola lacisaponensis]